MSDANIDETKKLELTSIKKYQIYTGQVEMKLEQLYDYILTEAIFVKYS